MDIVAENVSKHFGLPWSGLIEQCRKMKKEKPPDESNNESTSNAVTTRLIKEDASTFGLRPALDECLLSVCDQCGAVIKPQALYSHIERRHTGDKDASSVKHLLTEKPIVKGPSFKSKNKNSPRNSPKLASNCSTSLLDKYKLPKPPINRGNGAKFTPGSLERSNSALAKHLSTPSAQPVVALDELSPQLKSAMLSPSSGSSSRESESRTGSVVITPKSSHKTMGSNSSISLSPSQPPSTGKKFPSKRSLDSSLTQLSKADPPKKPKTEPKVTSKVSSGDRTNKLDSKGLSESLNSSITLHSFLTENLFADSNSPPAEQTLSLPEAEPVKPPAPATSRVHQLTTFDKSIPCKDREYDPNRHCGCWLEEWGKHCTRSLTCKSHALSMRRKVPGRSKPFDTLLNDHRAAKEALELHKLTKGLKGGKPAIMASNKVNRLTPNLLRPGDTDSNSLDSTVANDDEFQGYSSFHPRPLATPSYGARLCGNSYVANRQMDLLRQAVRFAIDQPKPTKKLCSAKSVKSVNHGGPKAMRQASHDNSSSLSSSIALFHKAQSAAVKNNRALAESRKKLKRASGDSDSAPPTSRFSHSLSHQIGSPPLGIPHSPALSLALSADALHSNQTLKSALSSVPMATASAINLVTNGSTNQTYQTNMLKDLGGRPKVQQANATKLKLSNRNSINLTTNASGIASLANKHLLLDGLPYTAVYPSTHSGQPNSANNINEQTIPTGQPMLINSADILSRAANGIVMHQSGERNLRIDNQSAALVELIPRSSATGTCVQHVPHVQHVQHLTTAPSMHYIKAEGNPHISDGGFIQTTAAGEKLQQLAAANGTITNFGTQVRAMQIKQQPNKQNISLTLPLISQPVLAQHQTLHHGSAATGQAATATTANAHQGFS